jgi:glycosyltransferase involved in cell wall biosynthesis
LTARLGASKVYLELAEGFRRLGWGVTLVGPEASAADAAEPGAGEHARLRGYLRRHAAGHDVVEYEHNRLPYPRSDFSPGPLFVARSVLLTHSVTASPIPPVPTLRGRVGRLLKGWQQRRRWRRVVGEADRTLQAADLIQVCNDHDRDLLLDRGYPADKVLVLPFGLFPERLGAFHPTPEELPDPPVVAFVGTFDPRKGMAEFPRLVAHILRQRPRARFRLCGTAGLIQTAEGVTRFFPAAARPSLEVVPRFDPAELPGLLRGCSLGIFPSWCEGFGFGVLEMLAAGLPVLAYDAPGPPMMLPRAHLVRPGDAVDLARRAADLLGDPARLRLARRQARARAEQFAWDDIVSRTADAYLGRLARRGRALPGITPPGSPDAVHSSEVC